MAEKSHKKVLVIGTGLAGLSCALTLADNDVEVTLVTKAGDPTENNSSWAQGGIVYREEDDHGLVQDILQAGLGVGYRPAIEQLVDLGQRLVQEQMIQRFGIRFDQDEKDRLARGREGAHSCNRIIHVGDATGKVIQKTYLKAAMADPRIEILSNQTAVDLLTTQHHCRGYEFAYRMNSECLGAYLLDNESGEVRKVTADFTVLATGGVGHLFLHSTNSPGSIGDGLVMALRAGAATIFPHYIQFHPTSMWLGKRRFLISEAVRGAGARLLNGSGERFMERYNPNLMELAPRDEVTRAIIQEMIQHEEDHVYLDLSTHRKREEGPVEERFPTIFKECLKLGVDIRNEPIPVVPAAHYLCGGIKVDLTGRTTLDRLYAVGEVACTGVHGANRLASTSLLECLTWGFTAGRAIASELGRHGSPNHSTLGAVSEWENVGHDTNVDRQRLAGDWSRMRTVMWNYVGIVRSRKLLNIAEKDFRLLSESLTELYHNTKISKELVDLFHGIQACCIIVGEARRDSRSIGCHYLLDS